MEEGAAGRSEEQEPATSRMRATRAGDARLFCLVLRADEMLLKEEMLQVGPKRDGQELVGGCRGEQRL
jgi:hypothetical protein